MNGFQGMINIGKTRPMRNAHLSYLIALSLLLFRCGNPSSEAQKTPAASEATTGILSGEGIQFEVIPVEQTALFKKMDRRGKLDGPMGYIKDLELYKIVYESDGMQIEGFMCRPVSHEGSPIIIYNRGFAPKRQALTPASVLQSMGQFAKRGFTVFSSNYRGLGGNPGNYEFGGDDVNDVVNLVHAIGTVPELDTNRMALVGLQRGGLINLRSLTLYKGFDCMLNINGFVDAEAMAKAFPKFSETLSAYMPEIDASSEAELQSRTAKHWINEMSITPMLMVHRQSDSTITMDQVEAFCTALDEEGRTYQMIEIAGKRTLQKRREEVMDMCSNWLKHHLDETSPLPFSEQRFLLGPADVPAQD